MESRKLIKSGPSSLSITLPNKWLKDNNLLKGDSLFLDTQKDSIKILPQQNISKINKKKEYSISADKLYLIKEHLNYCFVNNIYEIKINFNKKEDIESILKLIESFPGYTHSIFEHHVLVTNLLDLENINPENEFNSILSIVFYIFKEICENDDETKQELMFKLKSLKRRTFIAYSSVNKLLDSPLEVNKFKINLEKLIYLKVIFKELPFLIDSEIEFIKVIGYINDLTKYDNFLNDFKNLMSSLSYTIEKKVLFKSLKEKLNSQLNNTKNVNEIKFLNELNNILSSFLRIL